MHKRTHARDRCTHKRTQSSMLLFGRIYAFALVCSLLYADAYTVVRISSQSCPTADRHGNTRSTQSRNWQTPRRGGQPPCARPTSNDVCLFSSFSLSFTRLLFRLLSRSLALALTFSRAHLPSFLARSRARVRVHSLFLTGSIVLSLAMSFSGLLSRPVALSCTVYTHTHTHALARTHTHTHARARMHTHAHARIHVHALIYA